MSAEVRERIAEARSSLASIEGSGQLGVHGGQADQYRALRAQGYDPAEAIDTLGPRLRRQRRHRQAKQ